MCNEIQCNGHRPEPLSEEERKLSVYDAKAVLRNLRFQYRRLELFLAGQIVGWAATVAERDKRIAALHKQGGRLFCQRAVTGDLVVGLHCDNSDVLIGARLVAGHKDIEQIEAYIAALRGDPASHEATQGKEEEGDGHEEGS